MKDKKTENIVRRIISLFSSKWWVIVLMTLVGIGIAYGATYLMDKQYSANVLIFANCRNDQTDELTTGEISVTTSLIKDYRVFATSRTLLANVNQKLKADGLHNISADNVSVAAQSDSRNFTVTVKSTDPQTSCNAASYIADELIKQIEQLYNVDNVTVIDPPVMSNVPVSPNIPVIVLFGAFIGFFIGIGIMYIIFISDKAVKSVEDFEAYFDIPVLGIIPEFDKSFAEGSNKYKKRSSKKNSRKDADSLQVQVENR